MAHNSRRKEIIFMGKIRWIRACALLIMTAAIITACGRGNGNNMTTAPDTGSAGAGTTMERQTNGTNQSTNAPSQTAATFCRFLSRTDLIVVQCVFVPHLNR